jgi:hypothetical protein
MVRGREILTALFVFVTVCSNTNLNDIMDEEELLFSKSFCKNLYAESSKTMVTALSYPPVLVTNNTLILLLGLNLWKNQKAKLEPLTVRWSWIALKEVHHSNCVNPWL